MSAPRWSALLWSLALFGATVAPVRAQNFDWSRRFHLPGANMPVDALTVFDDGHGPSLYAAGDFTEVAGVSANRIARWSGTGWYSLGQGITGSLGPAQPADVTALSAYDDGTGPGIVAAGYFATAGGAPAHSIARWNGSSWSALATTMTPIVNPPGSVAGFQAVAVWDDGAGPALYAGGSFLGIDGVPASNIAKWNGAVWQPLGLGVDAMVWCLAVYDDGAGPALFAGGSFQNAGGVPASSIARWNGATWTPLGSGTSGTVYALAVHDDGTGPHLVAGGNFASAGGGPANDIARWDGASWSAVGSGTDGSVRSLAVHDDGTGPALYAGGNFLHIGGTPASCIARWNGATWSPLGSGTDSVPWALAVFDDGAGPALHAGGLFEKAGNTNARRLAKWRGAEWSPVGDGDGIGGLNLSPVLDLCALDVGTGPALFAAGGFATAGGTLASNIASWTDAGWSPLGSGTNLWIGALVGFDDGSGPALYAGGSFTMAGGVPAQRIARWRSTGWSQVGLGLDSSVYALAVFDDGTTASLYAGGLFVTAGGTPANRIARWNGTSWSPLGAGVTGGTTGHCGCLSIVECLVAFDDGTGPALYAGGNFMIAGGTPALNVARWNGTSWSAVGAGLGASVRALAVFDDGAGPALFAAGSFAEGLVKWTGTSWSTFGANPNGGVNALQVFDAGSGAALYVGGDFTSIGGIPAQHVARWDGTTWSPLGAGVGSGLSSDNVYSFAVFDDGSGGGLDLYAGGHFSSAGGVKSSNLAAWRDFEEPGEVLCTGDGILGPCPCANSGAPGHGCENSASTGGARLFSSGSTSPDTILLHANGELPTALSIFLQGTNVSPPAPFGDGLRCASGILKRLYVKAAVAGTASAPGPGDPPISVRSAQLGDTIHPGNRRYYQVYYRDPDLAFCADPPGGTFNVTNGVKLAW